MGPVWPLPARRFRTVWISDVHLGTRGCKADFLLDFLRSTECDYLYLVGDIVDLWNMKRGLYWPQSHNNVIRTVLGKAKHDTRVVYIPGNHDELLRDFVGMEFGNVRLERECVHTTRAGKRLLVMHGDQHERAVQHPRLIVWIGDHAYYLLLYMNRWFNRARGALGMPYWSLATWLKQKMGNAVRYIHKYEQAVIHEARRRGLDGVVCGHIHRGDLDTVNGLLYCNDGDWVENCTALVEHHDGTLQLLHWADQKHTVKFHPAEAAVPTDHAA